MVGGGLQNFSVSPRPLGFCFQNKGFGTKGLGPGLDNMILYRKGQKVTDKCFYDIGMSCLRSRFKALI